MAISKFIIFSKNISYRQKLSYIVIGLVIGLASLAFINYIVRELAIKEKKEIRLWSHAMTMLGGEAPGNMNERELNDLNRLLDEIISTNTTIPSIITNEHYDVLKYSNISKEVISHPEKLRKLLERMAESGNTIELSIFNQNKYYIFYSESTLLKMLRYSPYVQLGVIAIFIMFAFITFRSSKQDEQKRVWIGMAKETAHQLGTPTSSLLGWIEYLKSQNVETFVIDEMNKDITRLLKVVDRFSKIGSKTILVPRNIFEIVENAVVYFQTRIPKNVELRYSRTTNSPLQAIVNEALFEWVIENLLKNALDALSGKGLIEVTVTEDSRWIIINVRDTGKGIQKSNFTKIFSPGFTTKTRGWGLGLSLSKRIIEDYHHGKIFVAESEIDKGTTIRIQIMKL